MKNTRQVIYSLILITLFFSTWTLVCACSQGNPPASKNGLLKGVGHIKLWRIHMLALPMNDDEILMVSHRTEDIDPQRLPLKLNGTPIHFQKSKSHFRQLNELYNLKTKKSILAESEYGYSSSFNNYKSNSSISLLANGNALLTGGFDTEERGGAIYHEEIVNSHAEIFDYNQKRFKTIEGLNPARRRHITLNLPNGNILIAGGIGNKLGVVGTRNEIENHAITLIQEYDPKTGVLKDVSHLKTIPGASKAVLWNQKVIFFSGYHLELYDPIQHTSQTFGHLKIGRHDPLIAVLPDNKIIIAGPEDVIPPCKIELFDPKTGQSELVKILQNNIEHLFPLPDGRVLLFSNNNIHLLDPINKTDKIIDELIVHRQHYSIVQIKNHLYILGGFALAKPGENIDPMASTLIEKFSVNSINERGL